MIKRLQAVISSLRRFGRRVDRVSASHQTDASSSALKRQLDLMEEREQGLRITLASMGDGVIATDEKARVTFLNPSAEELTGWALKDAVGQPFTDIFRIYNSITGEPG